MRHNTALASGSLPPSSVDLQRRKAGVTNVEFLKGEIENIPLPDDSVALEESDYRAKLRDAGFESVDLEPTRVHDIEDTRVFLTEAGIAVDAAHDETMSSFGRDDDIFWVRGKQTTTVCNRRSLGRAVRLRERLCPA
jgi:hypothetical protein